MELYQNSGAGVNGSGSNAVKNIDFGRISLHNGKIEGTREGNVVELNPRIH